MPCPQESRVPLFLLQFFLCVLASGHDDFSEFGFLSPGKDHLHQSSIVHPVKIDVDGRFVSHTLAHHFGGDGRPEERDPEGRRVYYHVDYEGRVLVFNLTANTRLVSRDYVVVEEEGRKRRRRRRSSDGSLNGTAEHRGGLLSSAGDLCHLIGTVAVNGTRGTAAVSTCNGLKGLFYLPEGHFFIEPAPGSPDQDGRQPHVVYPHVVTPPEQHRRNKRSSNTQGTHSPCGVKDGQKDWVQVEREREDWEAEQSRAPSRSQRSVAGIFHDASIGNAIHIILVRFILLNGEEKDLKIVHHADTSLSSFCAWQKNVNPQSDTHPAHHDVAVLVTRKDICAGMNQPCETLGLSHLSGMCQPHRSCNINEDSGLPVAFTIAHEMGHSFGIHHDGQGNDCELEGRHPFIMSRQLMYDSSPLTWSACSKDYITRFLDRGWGFCLDDRPSKRDLMTPLARLGVRYTTHHQCKLQYGPNATFCPEVDNVCQILWCSVNGTCRSKLDSPIDGTRCAPEKFGGKYCTGERKRYRTCNTKLCQKDSPSFREMLCSEFDTVPYQNELYQWIPVANPCKSSPFSDRSEVGCDYGIDSNALEDRCGVCLGDGSSCETVYKTFDGGEGFGYVDVGVIPRGARDILVQEVQEAGNFLALRGPGPEDYFLNGNYIIQWNGAYEAGGTTFYYERSGNMENLTAPGPTKNPVVLQLLYQETNPGIKYEYTIKKAPAIGNEVMDPVYIWRHGAWTDCSTTCGLGQQHQPARCFEVDMGVVDETLCDPGGRPADRHRKCKNMDCPARWWVGGWQHCTSTCGLDGVRKRTVLCVRTVSGEERVLHPVDCKHLLKPKPVVPCNRDVPCAEGWAVGTWEECPVTCGGGVRSRSVTCTLVPKQHCDPVTKPRSRALCGLQSCPNSSLRRRPGPPPKYRRIFPPKTRPNNATTPHPKVPTTTASTTTTQRTTAAATATPLPTSSTAWETTTTTERRTTGTTAGILDDDYEFDITVQGNLVVKKKSGRNLVTTEASTVAGTTETQTHAEAEEEEEEEEEERDGMDEEDGSTGDGVTYSPIFDPVDDETANEKGIIDLDVVATTVKSTVTPLPSTRTTTAPATTARTTTAHRTTASRTTARRTTARRTTASRTARTTRAPATRVSTATTPRATTGAWAKKKTTTRHYQSHTTPFRNPYTDGSHRVHHHHHTTTGKPKRHPGLLKDHHHHHQQATPPPASLTTKTFRTTTDGPHTATAATAATTARVVKLKKPAEAGKKNNAGPPSKKPSGGRAKDSAHPSAKNPPRPRGPAPPVCNDTAHEGNQVARESVTGDVFWVAGNWSECSTSCGVGAVWRMVVCSTQREADCVSLQRPEPARTCHLQPCATWLYGNWTTCPEDCAVVGRRQRDIQCVDAQTKRPLRPFHCQALSSRPPSSLPCPHRPCLTWDMSPWGECSRSCGAGSRERLVSCPEPLRCSASRRPNSTEPKNSITSRFCDKLKLLGRCSLRSVQRQCCVTCGALKQAGVDVGTPWPPYKERSPLHPSYRGLIQLLHCKTLHIVIFTLLYKIWMDHQNMSEHVLCMVLYLIELGLDNQLQEHKEEEEPCSEEHCHDSWFPGTSLLSNLHHVINYVRVRLPETAPEVKREPLPSTSADSASFEPLSAPPTHVSVAVIRLILTSRVYKVILTSDRLLPLEPQHQKPRGSGTAISFTDRLSSWPTFSPEPTLPSCARRTRHEHEHDHGPRVRVLRS
ncbi:hypothetical protein CRUP_036361 [Coryphaenoides rupestris]|nr:hypothetical protein CRUP_036361 [Coryphaenoides rupestris]